MKKAFSLIELLIAIIIMSLILAAFVPLISKKLKASDITVGSFGKGGGGSLATLTRNVTKEDCDKFNALYISAAMNDGIKPICVTKWNVGDNVGNGGVPIAGDVQKLNAGASCTDYGNCCWKGQTSKDGCNDSGNVNSSYSACHRTVCQWKAANTSCQNYSPIGTTSGMWRLPSQNELVGWGKNIKSLQSNKGEDGLQLCDWTSVDGSKQCKGHTNGCKEASDHTCYPAHIWSSTTNSSVYYIVYLTNGSFSPNNLAPTYAFSARCVLDSMVDTINSNEEDIEKDKHLEGEPQSQKDCDKLAPNLMFIDKAYNGTLGKNTCVTKYNIGDSGGPHLANIVDKTDVNNYCDGGYCCWVGKTSNECSNTGNGNSTYSGCNRTVCQWKGANATCALWAPDGRQGYWRLPSKTELDGWAGNLNKITLNMGKDGLQLCDESTSSEGSAQCKYLEGNCPGSARNYCYASNIWSSTEESSNTYYHYYLSGNNLHSKQNPYTYTFSSRCVYDGDYHYQNIQKETSGKAAYRQPYSQKDCDPYNAMFIPAKYNGTGGKNLCVTKYNAFDTGGPEIAYANNNYLNAMTLTGNTCAGDACCWKGTTASSTDPWGSNKNSTYGTSRYHPHTRTVCVYKAAKNICANWTSNGLTRGMWRLPSVSEGTGWADTIMAETETNPTISRWMGAGGLQLCDKGSKDYGSDKCSNGTRCLGAYKNNCYPSYVWLEDKQGLQLNNAVAAIMGPYDDDRAKIVPFSVRCVTSQVPNN